MCVEIFICELPIKRILISGRRTQEGIVGFIDERRARDEMQESCWNAAQGQTGQGG